MDEQQTDAKIPDLDLAVSDPDEFDRQMAAFKKRLKERESKERELLTSAEGELTVVNEEAIADKEREKVKVRLIETAMRGGAINTTSRELIEMNLVGFAIDVAMRARLWRLIGGKSED